MILNVIASKKEKYIYLNRSFQILEIKANYINTAIKKLDVIILCIPYIIANYCIHKENLQNIQNI